jgi:hypothetical protein
MIEEKVKSPTRRPGVMEHPAGGWKEKKRKN